ncbi:DUF255 domain-containing protein [Nakamurella sp. YIM 132087]|uniref:DUF255 domain-containing protein n=1 Tax=Nakamurella alba TaxID=2665158 RepID=A0A7K1FHT4_9ACTN|nr:thioredoxin domain-containing protein [Nakamurella alba]MTD12843.1 DUF255 domain-containing protein [Nakamurella alba]
MPHRLASAMSSYLLQHADNPVDWWEWEPAAFAEARERDVPVLLSVGYAACHWCHVMAHESFEDEATAAEINAGFVAIKVDREERPDVDAVYMTAVQALTGQGGWPMTCFLTPDGAPFYAGTYFPPEPRHGMPSFRQVLTAVREAWTGDRSRLTDAAADIARSLRETADAPTGGELPGPGALDLAARSVVSTIDPIAGGFRGAPKFPPAMICEFLLRHAERTGSAEALQAVEVTLDGMARGGIHDQLAGGFARYSVDSAWHVPHFEKMLDDNALLLRLYAHHARLTGSARSAAVARSTARFLLDELRTDEGVFAASLDADTGGVEGATYVWTDEQLAGAAGVADAAAARRWFAADGPEVEEVGGHVLRLPADPDDPVRFEGLRARLLAVRQHRPQPSRDDIVVLRSNALAAVALAEAGLSMDEPEWVDAAATALETLVRVHLVDGRWRRSSRGGRPGPGAAVLADVAGTAAAMLAVHQSRPGDGWLGRAEQVLMAATGDFRAPDGTWYDTADGAEDLVMRPRDVTDGAAPGGPSTIADALLTAAALTGRSDLREEAERILASVAALVDRAPRAVGNYLAVAEAMVTGPLQIAVSGPDGPERDALALAAATGMPGGSVIEAGPPDLPGAPLLAGRPLVGGRPAVYVCRGFVCDRPVTEVTDLESVLGAPPV